MGETVTQMNFAGGIIIPRNIFAPQMDLHHLEYYRTSSLASTCSQLTKKKRSYSKNCEISNGYKLRLQN